MYTKLNANFFLSYAEIQDGTQEKYSWQKVLSPHASVIHGLPVLIFLLPSTTAAMAR